MADRAVSSPDSTSFLETEVYIAALDTLSTARARVVPTGVRVLRTVHWWPMTALDGTLPAALGPLPFGFEDRATAAGREVRSVGWNEAVTAGGELLAGAPLVIFGPVDFIGSDAARLRMTLYLGPNGQEMYRVLVERSPDGWRARRLEIELQS